MNLRVEEGGRKFLAQLRESASLNGPTLFTFLA
jgi:hypothetical protein